MHKDFADWYREATIAPSLDELERRSSAVQGAAEAVSKRAADTVDLVEAVYGLGRPARTIVWFIDAMKEADPTLHLADNDNALTVLAACLIAQLLTDDKDDWSDLANAVRCASLSGKRATVVLPALARLADQCVARWQARNRATGVIAIPVSYGMDAKKLDTVYQGMTTAFDAAHVSDGVKVVAQQASAVFDANGKEISAFCSALLRRSNQQREEIDMLWWTLGGWIEGTDEPLASLPAPAAAFAAGWQVGRLIRIFPQPRALAAIVARALGPAGATGEITIEESIEALPNQLRDTWGAAAAKAAPRFAKVAPMTCALDRLADHPESWKVHFERTTGLDVKTKLAPRALAMQVAVEQVMIAHFGT